jgi:hypothetical protein
VLRTLDWPNPVAGGRVFATASVVPVGGVGAPTERYARLAKRSLRKARAAGALVAVAGSADAFWRLYVQASEDWNSRYPEQLIRYLVDTGIARIHEVSVDGRVVAALLTLVEGSHWMCWLAAQNAEGRIIAASYLAYDAVLAEASLSGVHMVNLGASAGGGSEFKHHLGAIPMEMRMWNETSPAATAITVARSVRRRVASVVRRPTGGHA